MELVKTSNEVIKNSHINVPDFQDEDDVENYFNDISVIDELVLLNSTFRALYDLC